MHSTERYTCCVDPSDGLKVEYEPAESEVQFQITQGGQDVGETICLDPTSLVALVDFLHSALADLGNPRFSHKPEHRADKET